MFFFIVQTTSKMQSSNRKGPWLRLTQIQAPHTKRVDFSAMDFWRNSSSNCQRQCQCRYLDTKWREKKIKFQCHASSAVIFSHKKKQLTRTGNADCCHACSDEFRCRVNVATNGTGWQCTDRVGKWFLVRRARNIVALGQ